MRTFFRRIGYGSIVAIMVFVLYLFGSVFTDLFLALVSVAGSLILLYVVGSAVDTFLHPLDEDDYYYGDNDYD